MDPVTPAFRPHRAKEQSGHVGSEMSVQGLQTQTPVEARR